MAFNHTDYIRSFLMIPGQNGATKYGVAITPAAVARGQTYWRIIGIHHLTGPENHGQHNVFCDVLDEAGKRLYGTKLVVENINHTINHVVIDKGENEPGTNAPMHWGDELEFYVATGGLASDHAKGFHIRHADEEPGTTRGHHSFYVVWQRAKAGQLPPVEEEPVEAPAGSETPTDGVPADPQAPDDPPPVDPVDTPTDDPQAPASVTAYAQTSATFYLISADGVRIGQVTTLEWARRIIAALALLEASEKDHPIERYIEELKKWNRGET